MYLIYLWWIVSVSSFTLVELSLADNAYPFFSLVDNKCIHEFSGGYYWYLYYLVCEEVALGLSLIDSMCIYSISDVK